MISIAKCPRCQQLVSLPEGVDLDTMVQCPLCVAEYALRDSLPPALIPMGGAALPVGESPAAEAPPADDAIDATAAAATAELGEPTEPTEAPQPVEDELIGAEAPDEAVAAAAAEGAAPAEGETPPEEAASPEAPADAEKPAEAPADDAGMFGFLHQDAPASPGAEVPAAEGSHPVVDTSEPSFAGFGMSQPAGERVAASVAARPRRKEKNVAKEMVGVAIGGFFGLLIGYYALNYFKGEEMDFLNIWLPGIAHTQKHWPGGTAGDESGNNDAEAEPPARYPAPPKPEGALQAGISRFLDMHFQRFLTEDKIRPESSRAPVSVKIDGEAYLTAGEGEVIETIEDVQIGGARLLKGFRFRREGDWWVELGHAEPKGDPADIAKVDPPVLPEPADLPEPEPMPGDEPLPPGYVGPRHRAAYSLAQLGEALKAAHTAYQDLPAQEAVGDSLYGELCRLAERLTFVDAEPDAPGLFDRQVAIETMLENLGLQPGRIAEIAGLALARLDALDASGGGIVMAGTAGREVVRDGLHGTMLAMPGAETAYNVLSDRPLGVEEGDTVLVAGVAVPNPSENLIGYPGTRPVVVWAGTTVRLPRPIDDPDDLPVEPPADEPPMDEPPADELPADEPPADEPPADEPPADEPPADEPPMDEPPADEPPAEEPADAEVPTDEMPDDAAPAEELPVEEAPAEEAPEVEAPVEEASGEEAPVEN